MNQGETSPYTWLRYLLIPCGGFNYRMYYKLRVHTWTPPDPQVKSQDKQQLQQWLCFSIGFVSGL